MYPNSQLQFTVVVLPSDDVLQTPWLWHVELERWRCHKGVTSFPSCTTRARARKGTKCIETQAAIARFEETFVFVHSTLYTRPTLWALAKETTYLIGATPAMTEVGIITLNNVLIAVCSCPTWIWNNIFLFTVECLTGHLTWFFYRSTLLRIFTFLTVECMWQYLPVLQ